MLFLSSGLVDGSVQLRHVLRRDPLLLLEPPLPQPSFPVPPGSHSGLQTQAHGQLEHGVTSVQWSPSRPLVFAACTGCVRMIAWLAGAHA
jgi:hypothetical protein